MIKAVIFDLDGTLTDPGEGITNSVAYALERYGIDVKDKSTLNCFIGPPLSQSFTKYFSFDEQRANEAVNFYREYFATKGIFENKLYDGVCELLSYLKNEGKTVILATSKPEVFARQILAHYGLEKYFSFIGGSNLDGSRTKKSEVIAYVMESCGISETNAVIMVGDREHDIQGAAENGIPAIGITWGYGDRAELETAGAKAVFDTPEETVDYILRGSF